MNEIEKKIEEIIKKAIDDNANIVPFTEAVTRKLSTLFTEMVEGELRGFEGFVLNDGILNTEYKEHKSDYGSFPLKYGDYFKDASALDFMRRFFREDVKQYLLERKIEKGKGK